MLVVLDMAFCVVAVVAVVSPLYWMMEQHEKCFLDLIDISLAVA
jgi:hypothetical protein